MIIVKNFIDLLKLGDKQLLPILVEKIITEQQQKEIIESYYQFCYEKEIYDFFTKKGEQEVKGNTYYRDFYKINGLIMWHKRQLTFYVTRGQQFENNREFVILQVRHEIHTVDIELLKNDFEDANYKHILMFLQRLDYNKAL